MPHKNLTDLVVQRLKYKGTQEKYWDTNLKGFGVRLGKKTKTFVVMTGTQRKLITIGHYPDIDLKSARLIARGVLLNSVGCGRTQRRRCRLNGVHVRLFRFPAF